MIANIIGALGILANVLIYQAKNGKNLLIFKLISDFLWALHYLLLGANTAAIIAAINIFRELVFYAQRNKQNKLWLIFFLIVSIISTVLTDKGIFSYFVTVASALSVISFWINKPKLSRYLAIPISASMLTYDVFCKSNMGIVNEILTLISAIMGIWRFRYFGGNFSHRVIDTADFKQYNN